MTVSTCQRHTTCCDQTEGSTRVRKFLHVLAHTSTCRRESCATQCMKMKSVILHFTKCGKCQSCRQFFSAIYFHAKTCKTNDCKMHFCSPTKRRIARLLESEEEI